jgi:anaerobic magnesium-protoporphyrin IX monomethyl ester cyclase
MSTPKTKVAFVTPPLLEKVAHHPLFPPLGLAYMAAVLEQNGVDVKIFDCPVCDFDHQKLKAELDAYQPTIVGVGSMTPTIKSALKSAEVAKEVCPDSKVVMGGPHATFADTEILTSDSFVDIIVRGEGEKTILELAKQAPKMHGLADVKGITFRKDNQIVRTEKRPFIDDLDSLPKPAYHLLPMEKYRITGRNLLPIISSRGCPFQCPFCVASQMFGARFRGRSPKNVLDEIEWLRDEHGAQGIAFQDDTFSFDKKRTMDICDGIVERKINLHWGCGTRADVVNKEVFQKMSRAHCDEAMLGVESGCQRMRDLLNKRVTNAQIENAVKWAKEAGIFVTVSVILGYPGETKESLQETLDYIRRIEPDDVWLCHATPYPGTCLRELVQKNGWKMSEDWELYNTMNPIFEDPKLPASEIAAMRRKFYNKFYSPRYIMRQAAKGYLKGNLYSKIMTRTALNYNLWRVMSKF